MKGKKKASQEQQYNNRLCTRDLLSPPFSFRLVEKKLIKDTNIVGSRKTTTSRKRTTNTFLSLLSCFLLSLTCCAICLLQSAVALHRVSICIISRENSRTERRKYIQTHKPCLRVYVSLQHGSFRALTPLLLLLLLFHESYAVTHSHTYTCIHVPIIGSSHASLSQSTLTVLPRFTWRNLIGQVEY